MEPIKFYIGQESGIVVENKDFDKSLFAEQYKQTFEIFNQIWQSQEKALANKQTRQDYSIFSNIIAFCGDRGEGKTSLLSSVKSILADEDVRKNAVDELHVEISPKCKSIKALELLDPLFFDQNHNLIELLLGQMIAEIIKIEQDRDIENYVLLDKRNDLLKKFESAKRRLKILSKNNRQEEYDELENLDDLAASIKLREELDSLFQDYAKYFKAEKLIISLDDIDLNMTEGFQMVEQIRKYISGLHSCILLVALKVDQMERLVMSSMRNTLNKDMVADDIIRDMARRYITKLLPLRNRVTMPSGTEIADKPLAIMDGDKCIYENLTIKEAVVRLIFKKTRFIFVNGRGLSPIVPLNLRDLRHLLGELCVLPEADKTNKQQHEANKTAFKQYFYYTWTKCLPNEYRSAVLDIVTHEDIVSLNKLVISNILKFRAIKDVIENIDQNEDVNQSKEPSLLNRILAPANTIYNVSLGDVYYVINIIEQKITDKDIHNLLFFLKAFYSIKLYELYDVISLDAEHYAPKYDEKMLSIYRFDEQLQQENVLQRLVNGSYFTYNPNDVLPCAQDGVNEYSRDKKNIKVKILREYFKKLDMYAYEDPATQMSMSLLSVLHMCEFFALTTTYPKSTAEYGKDYKKDYDRTQYDPTYLQKFDSNVQVIGFDVLSIFYNIINIKATYQRFSNVLGEKNPIDLYKIAQTVPDSLLNQMIIACKKEYKRDDIAESDFRDMHILISDAVIRFSEVQQSIMEMAKSLRYKGKEAGDAYNMRWLYEKIRELGITLYSISSDEKDGHTLKFSFLAPICDFLKQHAISRSEDSDAFAEIFINEKIKMPATKGTKTKVSKKKSPKKKEEPKEGKIMEKVKSVPVAAEVVSVDISNAKPIEMPLEKPAEGIKPKTDAKPKGKK